MVCLALLMAGLLGADGRPVTIAWDFGLGPFRSVGLVGRMTESDVIREVERYLKPSEITLGSLAVYATLEDRLTGGPLGGTDCNYDRWWYLLKRHKMLGREYRCRQVSEAIKIGSGIVLRVIDRDCRRRRVVLQGDADPSWVQLAGSRHEVLQVSVRPDDYRPRVPGAELPIVSFHVRTDAKISAPLATELLNYFRTVTGARDVFVALRNDSWFITHCCFPAIYPFDGRARIPTKSELLASHEVSCMAWEPWPIRCY